MTDTNLLIGSLSNDLLRVANLMGRGSQKSALTFVQQARRWIPDLKKKPIKKYLKKIILDLEVSLSDSQLDMVLAEKYLMYSVLLQNYTLHNK